MEITIRVIVVMFVALAVGSMIIMFARQTIDDAGTNLKALNVEKEQYILELVTVTPDEVRALVEQCNKDRGRTAVDRELCYVVHANINFDSTAVGEFTEFDVTYNFKKGNNALFIYYDIYGPEIDVEQ